MSFCDIKDPAERATLVKEYVVAMKTAKQRNMMNREMKLAIGDELQTLFHQIVNATAAEETRKELGYLTAQRAPDARRRLDKNTYTTFGFFKKQDGQLSTGNKVVQIDANWKTLLVDDTEYKLTAGLLVLITSKLPPAGQWNSNDYKSLVAQTKVKSFPNRTGTARPHATWKWKHMFRKMVIPGERIAEEGESEDTDDTDSVESYPDIASIGDIGESSDVSSPVTPGIPPSPLHTRSYGKAKKTKDRKPFYKGYGIVYLPGDINGLTKKLHLLAAEFFAGNTTVRNESRCGGPYHFQIIHSAIL